MGHFSCILDLNMVLSQPACFHCSETTTERDASASTVRNCIGALFLFRYVVSLRPRLLGRQISTTFEYRASSLANATGRPFIHLTNTQLLYSTL